MPATKNNVKVKNLRSSRQNMWVKPVSKIRRTQKGRKIVFYLVFAGLVFIFLSIFLGTKIYQNFGISAVSALKNGSINEDGSLFLGENINVAVLKVGDRSKQDSKVNGFYLININVDDFEYRIYEFPIEEPFNEYLKGQTIVLADLYKVGNANI
jgi:hypothetical protein